MSLDITPAEAQLIDDDCVDAIQPLPARTIVLMATACGISAANLYYNQPLLEDFARQFHASDAQASLVATASQVGYGVGMLCFVPLGDLLERRRVVVSLVIACAVVLALTVFAPTLWSLILLQLLIGMTATSTQVLIPLSVDLTPPAQRGSTIGKLMCGLLVGILLARTVAGEVATYFGWRAVFGIASVSMIGLAVALVAGLPRRTPANLGMTYGRLMRSMFALPGQLGARLLAPAIIGGITFGCFSGFWTVLSFLVRERFGGGPSEAGMFGIVGVVGVCGAPLAGRLSDRKGSAFTVGVSIVITIVAFALMWPWSTIAGLAVGVLLMDLGVQATAVACQSIVMALMPDARSRLNTLFMVIRFIGGAAGSFIAAFAWTHGRWPAVCAVSIVALLVSLVVLAIGVARGVGRIAIVHDPLAAH